MANHSFSPNCEVHEEDSGAVQLMTLRTVEPGESLCRSYGDLNNDSLLMDYGFLLRSNPHDRISMRFGLSLLQV